ncbi:MAG: 50S ribosomal protein L20 [Deinococcales bacterium]
MIILIETAVIKRLNSVNFWIIRINVAREEGTSYSTFMSGLRKAGVEMNRKSYR